MVRKWLSERPEKCQICGAILAKCGKFVDARTNSGPWAIVCPTCHDVECNSRIGVGCGQEYDWTTLNKLRG